MRQTRILCAALHNPSSEPDPTTRVQINQQNMLAMLDRAEAYDPDFVIFPEAALHHALKSKLDDVAEPVPGPATDTFGEYARKIDSYVLLPMYERDGEDFYNSAVLLGPTGNVLGTCRKLAPTIGEMDAGIVPGTAVPTWETPFGTVGVAICWDNRYPEIGRMLATRGTDVLLYPTLGTSDLMNRIWARYNGYHLALCDKRDARVYTSAGDVVAKNGAHWKNPPAADVPGLSDDANAWWTFATINTDFRTYAVASSERNGWLEAIQQEYPGSLQVRRFPDDGIWAVECVSPDMTLDDFEAEFPGMERTFEYEERTRDRVFAENPDSPLSRLE